MRFDIGTLDSGERSLPFGLLVFHVSPYYIAPGRGRLSIGYKIFMTTERPFLFAQALQVSKWSLPNQILYTFLMILYMCMYVRVRARILFFLSPPLGQFDFFCASFCQSGPFFASFFVSHINPMIKVIYYNLSTRVLKWQNLKKNRIFSWPKASFGGILPPFLPQKSGGVLIREGAFIRINTVCFLLFKREATMLSSSSRISE